MKEPGLRVEPGASGVVRDAHVGAELAQALEGVGVGGAEVRGGQDAQLLGVSLEKVVQLGAQESEAAPLDEGDEQVDAIGGGELEPDLVTDAEIARAVDEEIAVPERPGRARQRAGAGGAGP